MDCLFIPILFGCNTTVKPEGDQQAARVCPNCHNASVIRAKTKDWFQICFVPVIPMSSQHIWLCHICQWKMKQQQGGWEPQVPNAGPNYPPPGWVPPSGQYAQAGGYAGQPQPYR
ncbi:hypothetical protein BDN72DRAFT_848928 [Pluteus cervinus]|uniref:Uncharacterized protein n=1 Tax=Pluteus cervinus TaxID=181527 RepID=A0ACD3A963_9AGAR|nr:hypothetical protein BDN72DRAFT_848928 [Pluteus cervinus]